MSINVWLDRSDQLVAGAEIFRSHRKFQWWDYTPSHNQLLLRCDGGSIWTRVDVHFKAVSVMKVQSNYNGLHIRCATPSERDRIQSETPGITYFDPESSEYDLGCRYFILDDGSGGLDYVVAQAIGWHEYHDRGQPGYVTTQAAPMPAEDRIRYRHIYVVLGLAFGPEPHVYGTFLTRGEAEHNRKLLADRYPDGTFTIDETPVRV